MHLVTTSCFARRPDSLSQVTMESSATFCHCFDNKKIGEAWMKKATSPFLNLRMVPQCLFRPCFLERVQMSDEVRCLKAAALVLNERPGSPKYDCRKEGKVWMVGMVGMVSRFFHQGVGWSWPLERTCLNGSSYIHRLDMGHGTWFHGLKRVFFW